MLRAPTTCPLRSRAAVSLPLLVAAAMTACSATPSGSHLRFAPDRTDDWRPSADGRLHTTALGAAFTVVLDNPQTSVELQVENPGDTELTVAFGPESMRGQAAAIGERRSRTLQRDLAEGATDFVPYRALEPVTIPGGYEATIFLDSPLGREPTYGQYVVLVLEVRSETALERRLLPLVASTPRQRPAPGE